jgi:hypothetical protein
MAAYRDTDRRLAAGCLRNLTIGGTDVALALKKIHMIEGQD